MARAARWARGPRLRQRRRWRPPPSSGGTAGAPPLALPPLLRRRRCHVACGDRQGCAWCGRRGQAGRGHVVHAAHPKGDRGRAAVRERQPPACAHCSRTCGRRLCGWAAGSQPRRAPPRPRARAAAAASAGVGGPRRRAAAGAARPDWSAFLPRVRNSHGFAGGPGAPRWRGSKSERALGPCRGSSRLPDDVSRLSECLSAAARPRSAQIRGAADRSARGVVLLWAGRVGLGAEV
jgi:hypothetical protein